MARNPRHLGLLAVLLIIIWGTAWLDYRDHTAEHRRHFEQLGEALIGASEGVVLRLCRGGRYDPDELQEAVDELRMRFDAQHLVLSSDTADAFMESGTASGTGAQVFTATFNAPGPRGQGRRGPGPPGLLELPGRALTLKLELATDSLDDRLAADLRRFLGLAGSLSAVLLLSSWVASARLRAVALSSDLGQAREELQSLEFLRRLGAGLAHETRTPLGVLRGFAQELSSGNVPAENVPVVANTIIERADRTVSRLDEFMLLSRPAELRRERFELGALLTELAELLHPDLEAVQGQLELEPFQLQIDADKEQTRRLFMNLMINGVQALHQGGTLRIDRIVRQEGSAIRVSDDGPGVPRELIDSLFEPYATMRDGGTGLGLAIVRRIANEHGWEVTHEAVEPHGAAFIVSGMEA